MTIGELNDDFAEGSMKGPNTEVNDGTSPIANILIADDDPSILETLSLMVSRMGLQHYTAKNGQEAVELYRAHSDSISLVVMDVEMPRLGGIQAAHRIREMNPSAKLVLISGHSRQNIWRAKPNAFIPKPFMHIDLHDVVMKLLREDLEMASE